MSDDMNREFSGDGERIFDSSRGYVIVDPDGSIWECDISGYRITSVPDNAVELLPAITAEDVRAAERDYYQARTEQFDDSSGSRAQFVAEWLNRR